MSADFLVRLPVVGVMGSGREEHREWAVPLGKALAGLGVHLLTGGGGGAMRAVSEGFAGVRPREGLVIGVLPGEVDVDGKWRSRPGYPNEFVELPVRTHLPLSGVDGESPGSRNPINVLTSEVLVILPGGAGTASEARLARNLGRPAITLGLRREGFPHAETTSATLGFVRRTLGLSL